MYYYYFIYLLIFIVCWCVHTLTRWRRSSSVLFSCSANFFFLLYRVGRKTPWWMLSFFLCMKKQNCLFLLFQHCHWKCNVIHTQILISLSTNLFYSVHVLLISFLYNKGFCHPRGDLGRHAGRTVNFIFLVHSLFTSLM